MEDVRESELLSALLRKGFQMSGENVPLGFDSRRIAQTLAKLPRGLGSTLEALFATSWPSDSFFLGRIELLGPDRINQEHDALLPGCLIVNFGFLCIGSDGAGTLFSYCVDDGKVYLIPHEYVSEDAVYARPWNKLEVSAENIKAIAEQSWDSLGALFEWALAGLNQMDAETENKA
jgi:hypothetical protein